MYQFNIWNTGPDTNFEGIEHLTRLQRRLLFPPAPHDVPSFEIAGVLQDIVNEALVQGVWIARARRLRGQGLGETRSSIRLVVTAALSRKECEHAAGIIKTAVAKVLAKRR